jgi:drug/metabolite transporter (DMT)-like permease
MGLTLNRNRAGIGLMCLGILFFSLNDVMGKWLVATYSVGQILLIRSFAALLILSPFIVKMGWRELSNLPNKPLQALRVAFGTLEVAAFYWAVTYLSLAAVMTYYLAGPLYVAALAPFLLREKLARDQWLAIFIGFIGVLMVLRPSSETLTLPAMTAIIGSLLFAGLLITTRQLRGTSGTALIVWQVFGALIFGIIFAPISWVEPSLRDFLLLALLGIVSMAAHMLVTQSLKLAPASIVSPFQYMLLVWATLFGWIFFQEWPDNWMIAGAAVIVSSGLYLMWREGNSSKTAS